jgi:hypothetical protein
MVGRIAAAMGAEPISRNFERWPFLGMRMDPFHSGAPTYQGEIDYLKSWLGERGTLMDAEYRTEFGECPAAAAGE